jgi:hypothetical protein
MCPSTSKFLYGFIYDIKMCEIQCAYFSPIIINLLLECDCKSLGHDLHDSPPSRFICLGVSHQRKSLVGETKWALCACKFHK